MRFVPFLISMAAATAMALGNEMEQQQGEEEQRELNEQDDCGRNSAFTAYMLIEHEMKDPYDLNVSEILTIAEGFKSEYNTLSFNGKFAACDDISLRFAHVPVLDAKDIFYEEFEEIEKREARRNFLYSVTVSGVDVGVGTRLFDFAPDPPAEGEEPPTAAPGKRRELLSDQEEEQELVPDDIRELFTVPPEILENAKSQVCECQSKAGTFESRAPTELEFKQVMNSYIRSMQRQDKLTNLGKIIHVTELEQVDCTPDTYNYETDVVIDFQDTPPEEFDVQQLGTDFKDAYNDYSTFFCDPCFNVVTDVVVEKEALPIPESRRGLTGTRLINKVQGKCRKKKKCKKKRKLFDDALRRRGLAPLVPVGTSGHGGRYRRRLVDENACYCPTQPEAIRPPRTYEFLDALNSITETTSDMTAVNIQEETVPKTRKLKVA